MTERKKRVDFASFVVTIADVDALAVNYLQVLARPGMIRRGVLDSLRESALSKSVLVNPPRSAGRVIPNLPEACRWG